jgi:hypothetical protein
MAGRHGARYPTSGVNGEYKALSKVLQANAASITNTSWHWLGNWTSPFDGPDYADLSYTGSNEWYQLGQRLGKRFTMLKTPYREDAYNIQTTQVSRAAQSANAFALGLFAGDGNFSTADLVDWWTYSDTSKYDNVLRYFDNCKKYINLNTSYVSTHEKAKWSAATFQPIANRISQMLGGPNPTWIVDDTSIYTMWGLCGDYYSIFGETRFCDLFEQSELDTITYMDDMDYWITKGYGFTLDWTMAASLVDDIVQDMIQSINGTADQKLLAAKLRFAHAETVIPLFPFFGLYNDSFGLWGNASLTDIQNRVWRTSNGIGFYALNIIFDMYSCTGGPYRVRTLVNEQEVQMPGCTEIYCDFDTLISAWGYGNYPSFNAVCNPLPCCC